MHFEGLCVLLADQRINELENDVSVFGTLEEEFCDSGVIAAFENFTSELKKSFWVIVSGSLHCGLL